MNYKAYVRLKVLEINEEKWVDKEDWKIEIYFIRKANIYNHTERCYADRRRKNIKNKNSAASESRFLVKSFYGKEPIS
jgi:hypothetical protein